MTNKTIPDSVHRQGLVLLGCGKMGSALLEGWLARGLSPASVWVVEPYPTERVEVLTAEGLTLNGDLPDAPAVVVIAVKPQVVADALPAIRRLANGGTLFLSIVAGSTFSGLETRLGAETPIVRAMPNTPAAVGRAITGLVGNGFSSPAQIDLALALMSAVGDAVQLENEAQFDAVTAVSGSGPAYVFHLVEAMAAAGTAAGLAEDLAMRLARATVAGAGALLDSSDRPAAELRRNVTSPGGTTEAGLVHLADGDSGLTPLLVRTVAAAAHRSRELGR